MVLKRWIKFTILLLVINVNNLNAQVGFTTNAARQQAILQKEKLADNAIIDSLKFRNVGPSAMSGRVVDVAVNPQKSTEFFVAYATGGLWHTKNNGQSFVSVFDKENVIGLGAVAADFKSGVVYAGTGEANSSRSSYAGDGIYKSTDTGKTWKHVGLVASQHIGKIIINPFNVNEVWVAVLGNLYSSSKERGLYHTTDGGISWVQSLSVDENTGAIDVILNPLNPRELYVSFWYRTRSAWNFEESGRTSAIYKTTDGGANWKNLTSANTGLPNGDNIGRTGIALCASKPEIIYAVIDNQNHRPDTAAKKKVGGYTLKDFENISKEKLLGLDTNKLDSFLKEKNFDKKYNAKIVKQMVKDDLIKSSALFDYLFDANAAMTETPVIGAEVYRSDNAGASWKKVNTKPLNLFSSYGYYFANIFVSPTNQDKVLIGGFDFEASTDGGKTFQRKDRPSTHADWHAGWIDPADDKHWIAGNDGGINVTYDDGAHWFKGNTPSVGQFYNIAVDNAVPYNIYGGLQDNGTWVGPSDAEDTDQWSYQGEYPWKQIGGGDGMQVQVDTRDNKTAYYGSQFGFYNRRLLGEKSRAAFIYPHADLGEERYRYNWQTPILLSKYNQDILYYATNKVMRSFDQGRTFSVISPDLTKGPRKGDVPFGTITAISESSLKFGLMYAGTDDGNVQITQDGGHDWKLISKTLPQNMYVSRVVASLYDTATVYATLNNYRTDDFNTYVYVSKDFGKTWNPMAKGLSAGAANVIIEDKVKKNILYLGADNGLFISTDAGNSFMYAGKKLPPVPVHDLVIQGRENELVIATHGRSIYVLPLGPLNGVKAKIEKGKREVQDEFAEMFPD